MELNLSEPQAQFYTSQAKYIAAVAGFGSGKTEVALARLISNMIEQPGLDQLYCAPTFPLVRDIFYPKVDDFLSAMNLPYKLHRAEHTIKIQGLGTIFCRTMEKPENLVGFSVGDAFLDEFDVLPTEKALHVFRKVSARLRQKKDNDQPNRLYITTTPEGFKATYQLFKKEPLVDSELIQMSTHSNAHNLPADYIESLYNQYPAELISAYIEGEFTNLTSGSVYPSYDRDGNDSDVEIVGNEPLIVGMDFNVARGCSVIIVERNGEWHCVDEIFNAFDTPEQIAILLERYPYNSISVYPDATGKNRKSINATKSDLKLLREAKFRVVSKNSNPPIKERIMAVNRQFKNAKGVRKLFVNSSKCPNLTAALEQQIYKNGMPEKGSGCWDDTNDALGYPVAYMFGISKPIAARAQVVSRH